MCRDRSMTASVQAAREPIIFSYLLKARDKHECLFANGPIVIINHTWNIFHHNAGQLKIQKKDSLTSYSVQYKKEMFGWMFMLLFYIQWKWIKVS